MKNIFGDEISSNLDETKVCKYCKSIINKRAKICPNCRKTLNFSFFRVIVGLLIFLTISIGIGYYLINNDLHLFSFSVGPSNYDNKYSSSYITLYEFQLIDSNMTYEEVKNIVGCDGTLISQSEIDVGEKYITKIYMWYGIDSISNANFMFQNNKLISKSQFGLY